MAEDGDERLQAFELLQAPYEEEIRRPQGLGNGLPGCWQHRLRRGNKIGQMHNGNIKPHLMVDGFAETARRDKGIYMLDGGLQQADVPPPLWRAFVHQATEETIRPGAGRTV